MAKKDKGILMGDPVTYRIPSPAGGLEMESFIITVLLAGVAQRLTTYPI